MLIAKADRTDLLHLGARSWETRRADKIPAPQDGGCVLVWTDKPGTLPDMIVVADGTSPDLLAWTTTYVPHLTPLTALVDILEHGRANERLANVQRQHPASSSREDQTDVKGAIGLIYAEVAAAFHGAFAPPNTGLTPYVSTLSWLAFQQMGAPSFQSRLAATREAWDEARRLLDARSLSYASDHVVEVWGLATNTPDQRREREAEHIAAFLESVRNGAPDPETLDIPSEDADSVKSLETGTLESRVEIFRRLVHSLYGRRHPTASHAAILGFALSRISQGSFAHVGLFGPSRIADARPLLWYGWFDFCQRSPEPVGLASSAAGLQMMREARNGFQWPRRDIAVEELRVLSRQKEPFADCLLDIRHPIGVAVADGATSLIQPGTPRRNSSNRARLQQASLFDDGP